MIWTEHVAILSSKLNKRLGLLWRIRHLLPYSAYRLLFYNCLVLPLFDYGDLLCLFLWNLPLEVFFDCLKVVALAPVAGGLVVRNTHVVHEITGMGKIKGLFHSLANKYWKGTIHKSDVSLKKKKMVPLARGLSLVNIQLSLYIQKTLKLWKSASGMDTTIDWEFLSTP